MRPAWPEDTVFRRLVLDVESDSCEHCGVGPVRRRLPVAADCHGAAPGVGLRAVEEYQHAGRILARPDQPETLIAH